MLWTAPFGTIKMRMGATHFLMKRLKNVRTEMALSVLAYNLTRVMGTHSALVSVTWEIVQLNASSAISVNGSIRVGLLVSIANLRENHG